MDTQQMPQTPPTPSSGGFLQNLENFFNTYLHQKVPFHLPPNAKEVIVKIGPWITLVLMLLALPMVLLVLGFGAAVSPYAMMYAGTRAGGGWMLGSLLVLVTLILEGMALPGLFARSIKGWRLVYYAVLVGAIGQMVSLQIVSLIINVAISMYFLFEIKDYYK